MKHRALRTVLDSRPAAGLFGLVDLLGRLGQAESSRELRILTYHRVADAAAFEQQMDVLAKRFHPIAWDDVRAALKGERALPKRSILVTFDDAYREFETIVWPCLRERSIPVVLFVPTAFPDQPQRVFWWDQLSHALRETTRTDALETVAGSFALGSESARRAAYRELRVHVKTLHNDQALQFVRELTQELDVAPPPSEVLGWEALRSLAREGVAMASHTHNHPVLPRLELQDVREEIRLSMEVLEREIGDVASVFAYPGGFYSPEVVDVVRELGFEAALTTQRGTNLLGQVDPLRLRRINIGEHAGRGVLRARILESAPCFNRWRPLPEAL